MLQDTLDLMPLWAFVAACGVTLAAGFVKGAVGFAMPLVMISGLSLFLDPLVAVAGIILPIVLSNVLQVMRFSWSQAGEAVKEFWRYIVIICVMILISAQFVTMIPAHVFYLVLGVPTVTLSLIQLIGVRFRVAPKWRNASEWIVGLISGTIGGLTGTWGPPTVLFLIALDTPKAKQMLVQGVVYGLGSVTLLVGHLQSGVLNAVTIPWSAALLIPGYLGMQMGFWMSDRMNAAVFRRATLVVLIVAGANLVRRGLLG
ncbi:sulfite exporter TauE/SafE family protein [Roseicyclus mahoneyensis]|uniref:Probable membrane transporter protein n=1 Tax=Roseicyclus mahoneyensis TaxID=164332 RepID=A0A316GHU6_9RHOB|nr:sulfite exporter TauE/SafE family protein [Roseicyclus mahoneyensis]PWK60140.1 hypothetical protein C7455_105124 [Roseicyclus mahoneyensis]